MDALLAEELPDLPQEVQDKLTARPLWAIYEAEDDSSEAAEEAHLIAAWIIGEAADDEHINMNEYQANVASHVGHKGKTGTAASSAASFTMDDGGPLMDFDSDQDGR